MTGHETAKKSGKEPLDDTREPKEPLNDTREPLNGLQMANIEQFKANCVQWDWRNQEIADTYLPWLGYTAKNLSFDKPKTMLQNMYTAAG